MKNKHYLFAINHPSQFHVFKNLAKRLMQDGHKCVFFIQQRDIIEELVKKEGFIYKHSVSPYWRNRLKGRFGIALRGIIHVVQASLRIFKYSLFNRVDMYFGTDVSITHVGFILRKPSMVFTDDDWYFVKQFAYLSCPFGTHIFAADVVDIGKWEKKKIAYKGNQKLGYLHPNVFTPDISVLEKYGLKKHGYTLIRLVCFAALHDSVHSVKSGLNSENLKTLFSELSKYGQVIVDTEQKNLPIYTEYQLDIDPEDMHSILYYARMFISDSQSMHVEAGLLGTPAIRTNAWVDKSMPLNVIQDLEYNYGLGVSISPKDPDMLSSKVIEMVQDGVKEAWLEKRKKVFEDYIDFTSLLYWFVTEYPLSADDYSKNPTNIISRFAFPV